MNDYSSLYDKKYYLDLKKSLELSDDNKEVKLFSKNYPTTERIRSLFKVIKNTFLCLDNLKNLTKVKKHLQIVWYGKHSIAIITPATTKITSIDKKIKNLQLINQTLNLSNQINIKFNVILNLYKQTNLATTTKEITQTFEEIYQSYLNLNEQSQIISAKGKKQEDIGLLFTKFSKEVKELEEKIEGLTNKLQMQKNFY